MPLSHAGQPISVTPIAHERCWAKTTLDGRPGINVRDHGLNVGCVAEALLDMMPVSLRCLLPRGVVTLAALHDIGKVSPGFQVKCEAWLRREGLKDKALQEGWSVRESDHAKIGQHTVQELFQSSQFSRWAAIIGAHHGTIKGERVQVREPWEEERHRLAEELISRFGPLPDNPSEEAMLWFSAGLITIADWIGSDEARFPHNAGWEFTERQRQGRTALAMVGWRPAEYRSQLTFEQLFPPYAPNKLQIAAMQTIQEPGIYVIEGPMGFGKTEAALAAAYRLIASGKASGLYFALPTKVTSNRIYLRVQQFLEQASVKSAELRLVHSGSWLLDTNPPIALRPNFDGEVQDHVRAGRSWFASAKRALLTSFGVGTIDQALLGVVAAKHFFVRQFGLAGKVVILDEVHSYDLYTGTLIDTLIQRLRELHCTVIVLSATLTQARRQQLLQAGDGQLLNNAYPLISGAANQLIEVSCDPPPAKVVAVRFLEPSVLLEDCLERARQNQCVLWIRNTVDDAQETYCRLKAANREDGPSIAVLHSRFPFFRREQLETCWMEALGKDSAKRPAGCVLVATQIAEQSVDIDADLLITDFAPTDMLLQRLGRLWRHERLNRRGQPEVWIQDVPLSDAALWQATGTELHTALGKSAKVYTPYVLLRSLQQWRSRDFVALPADIRAILEATYADPTNDEPSAWQELREQLEKHKRKLAACALSATQIWCNPALRDEEGVQTRYGTYPTAQLLLTSEITSLDSHSARLCLLDGTTVVAHDRDWDFDTAKTIHRNLTPVPYWTMVTGLVKPPGWLTNHVAQATAVARLLSDGNIQWPGDERSTELSYHADQGIIIRRKQVPRIAEGASDESYD